MLGSSTINNKNPSDITLAQHSVTSDPEGVHIVAGDFNKACLKSVLSKFHQNVKCPTRGDSTLDHVYSNIKHGYRVTA